MKVKKIFFAVLLFFTATNLLSQNPFIQHFTTFEGLPSNNVYKVFQDSKKFIWFATDAGVCRYDGTKFTYYRKQDGLSSNDVFDIQEDSYGRIWFFHINASLNFFYNNAIYNEKNTPYLDSIKNIDFSRKMYEDDNRHLYFYYNPQCVIYTLDEKNHVTKYRMGGIHVKNDLTTDSIEAMDIHYMNKNKLGNFSFWTPAGLYHTRNLAQKPILYNDEYKFKDVIVSSTGKKYILARKKGFKKYEIRRYSENIGLSETESLGGVDSEFISSILEDMFNVIWISTFDKGIFCYQQGKMIRHFEIKEAKQITLDHENNIWISSLKEGVYRFSPFVNLYRHIESSTFRNNSVLALCRNESGGVWCTNGISLFLLKNSELYNLDFQKSENSLNQIVQIKPDAMLVGAISKQPYAIEGLQINHANKKLTYNRITLSPVRMKKIIYNQKKNEISSYNQFFLIFIHPDRIFTDVKNIRIEERINNTFYNSENQLIVNAKRNLIFDYGKEKAFTALESFDRRIISDHVNLDKKVELFNLDGDSLIIISANKVYNLSAAFDQPVDLQIKHLFYKDSTLFLATSRNVYICKNPLNIIQRKPISLLPIPVNFKSIHDILFTENNLYIANDDGLTEIPYPDLKITNPPAPVPYFQSIQVNDQENLVNHEQISMKRDRRINITFSCINYSISPVNFSYKLEGADDHWTMVKGNNVTLQNLPKGNYLFKLRVRKPASSWSEPASFRIIIKEPIWQHPLFLVFVIIIVSTIVFVLVLKQKNTELDRRQMEHQMILLEQKSLQAMMNPHFIFNALGSIQYYLLHNKPNEAGIYLSQFARLIRQNLNTLNTSMVNLEEEIDRLKNYLDLEKLRMGDKFSYNIEISEPVESEEIYIPSMILQPFLENAIWHGIANLDEKGHIGISFQLHIEKALKITVEDTGVGVRKAKSYVNRSDQHLNLGLNITKKRLILLGQKYGIPTGVEFCENNPGAVNPGTKVTIVVPFIYGKSGENI